MGARGQEWSGAHSCTPSDCTERLQKYYQKFRGGKAEDEREDENVQ